MNPMYSQQPAASPIHLSSSVVVTSGGSGAPAVAAYRNPMGQDMELLEVKFELMAANLAGSAPVLGGTVWCELTMGGIKITNGSIPVWNFGRVEGSRSGEAKSDNTDNVVFASYAWRLPRPLFIPAGAVVTPKIVHAGFIPNAINVRVGYSARTVFTKPKKIYVPWVAKYASKAFSPISAAGVDASTELDLVNPNPERVYLQRFIGRTQLLTNQTSSEASQETPSQFLMVRMTDSYGRPIVRDYTPFRSVFGALTRSWEMDNGSWLDPEAYYIVQLRKDAMTVAAGSANAIVQAFVSVVGWRELENP